MPARVHTCKRCREELKVPERYHGRELKCPQCGEGFTVTPSPVKAATRLPVADRRPAGGSSGRARARPTAGSETASGPRGLGGGLAVVIGWLMIVALATLYDYLQLRETLADTVVVGNLARLQSGQILQYCRIAEVASAFMVLAVVVALITIFAYPRVARVVVVTVLAASLCLGVWDYFWVTQVFDESTRQLFEIPPGFIDAYLAGRVFACGLAIAYFLGSDRVKNTLR